MKPEQFVYWLQGYFEISEVTELNEKQTTVIKNHLGMVFAHDLDPKQEKELTESLGLSAEDAKKILDKIHIPGDDKPTMYRC